MLYHAENYSLAPEYDQYGMVIESTLGREDPWHVRVAVARAIEAEAAALPGCAAFAADLSRPGSGEAAVEAAASHAHVDMQAKYDALNPVALKKLVAEGTKLMAFPKAVIDAGVLPGTTKK